MKFVFTPLGGEGEICVTLNFVFLSCERGFCLSIDSFVFLIHKRNFVFSSLRKLYFITENYLSEYLALVIMEEIEVHTSENMERSIEDAEIEIIEENTNMNTAKESPKRNYAKTVGTEYEERKVNIEELFKHRQCLKRVGNDILLTSKKKKGFRTYSVKQKAIAIIPKEEVKKNSWEH